MRSNWLSVFDSPRTTQISKIKARVNYGESPRKPIVFGLLENLFIIFLVTFKLTEFSSFRASVHQR